MKYYVVSDIHGFYSKMRQALQEKGFFDDAEPHKLIVCGDALDRGDEAVEVQNFLLDLLHKDQLIFIRGNHEDLMIDMIENFDNYRYEIAWGYSHHVTNGTFSSATQLAGMDENLAFRKTQEFIEKVTSSPFYKELIPASINYYEIDNYIFVHGWIPHKKTFSGPAYISNWRNGDWENARWSNGMKCAEIYDIVEPGKKIVCGHWHTSYAHSQLEKKCSEFGKDADFSPYYGKNIIAIDSCVAHTGFLNCVVLED